MKKKLIHINIFSKKTPPIVRVSLTGAVVFVWLMISFFIYSGLRSGEATLILAFENDSEGRMFQGEVVDDMTVLDALITSAEAGQIAIRYNFDDNNGVNVISLDGYDKVSSEKQIVFYVNRKRVDERDINMKKIKPGDTIKVKLE